MEETDGLNATDASHQTDDQEDADWEYEDPEHLASSKLYEDDDALSKYSSETLSSTRSKRLRDEEDEDNITANGSPPESPGASPLCYPRCGSSSRSLTETKKARMQ